MCSVEIFVKYKYLNMTNLYVLIEMFCLQEIIVCMNTILIKIENHNIVYLKVLAIKVL